MKYFRKQKTEIFRLLEFVMCYPKTKIWSFQKKIIVDLNPPKPLSFVGALRKSLGLCHRVFPLAQAIFYCISHLSSPYIYSLLSFVSARAARAEIQITTVQYSTELIKVKYSTEQ